MDKSKWKRMPLEAAQLSLAYARERLEGAKRSYDEQQALVQGLAEADEKTSDLVGLGMDSYLLCSDDPFGMTGNGACVPIGSNG